MASVIWTAEARLDLDGITDYIARDSEHYAQAVADKILKIAKSIPEQPMMERMVPEVKCEDIRERFIYSYRLIYQIIRRSYSDLSCDPRFTVTTREHR